MRSTDIQDAGAAPWSWLGKQLERLRAVEGRRHHGLRLLGLLRMFHRKAAIRWPGGTATDPGDRGIAPNWAWAWPANRRILYNRASCDTQGKPWAERKKLIEWNGTRKWVGFDVPDYGPTVAPDKNVGPFILNPEGVARLFTRVR